MVRIFRLLPKQKKKQHSSISKTSPSCRRLFCFVNNLRQVVSLATIIVAHVEFPMLSLYELHECNAKQVTSITNQMLYSSICMVIHFSFFKINH